MVAFYIFFQSKNQFEIKSFTCSGNENVSSALDCYLKSQNRSCRTLYLTINFGEDVYDLRVKLLSFCLARICTFEFWQIFHITFFFSFCQMNVVILRKPLLTPGQYVKFCDTTENLCEILNGRTQNVVWKIGYLILKPYIRFTCPFKKRVQYNIEAFQYENHLKMFFPYVPSGRYHVKLRFFNGNTTIGYLISDMLVTTNVVAFD